MSTRIRRARFGLAVALLATSVVAMPGTAARANFPGANGKIAYVRGDAETSTSHIFVAGPDGSNPQRITQNARVYSGLDWSADGSKLAFEVQAGDHTEVWVMNHDGTEPRRVSAEGQSRFNPSWSPDGRYLAVDDRTTIYRIDTQAGHELALTQPEEVTLECLGHEYTFPVYYHQPSWSPEGARIAVIRFHEMAPSPNMDSCDFVPFFDFDLGVIPAGGGAAQMITDDPPTMSGGRFEALPDWSPDGSKIVVQRGAIRGSEIGIAVFASGGGAGTRLTTFGGRPRWSPDGTKILFTRDGNGDGFTDVWTMDAADGSDLAEVVGVDGNAVFSQDWQPTTAGELEVTLDAFGPDGTSLLDDVIGMSQTVNVRLTIHNPGDEEVTDFRFANDVPLVIDQRSTGGLEITDQALMDCYLSLEPDESVTFDFDVTATENGIAAAHTKVTATDESGRTLEDESHALVGLQAQVAVDHRLVRDLEPSGAALVDHERHVVREAEVRDLLV
ncbi:MAG TPA: LpqB family beta-propeller domain-containing protein, partial [Actinomycetota bacterium]|nr:LpqB family beta-propeller domain-containing protein [Actinomycetota bacterium]